MDSGALSDVLEAIRVKDTIAEMDDRPRFRRVYGTDIDPEYSRDSEWHELIARHKIKQRLMEAKKRRKSKIEDMEKLIVNTQGNSNTSFSSTSVKSSKDSLLAEYRAMKGNSVNLKPKPAEENDIDSIKEPGDINSIKEPNDSDSVLSKIHKKRENEETVKPAPPPSSPKSTLVVSAIIETIEVEKNERKPTFDDLEENRENDQALQGTGDPEVRNDNTDDVSKESSNSAGNDGINPEKNDEARIKEMSESSNDDVSGVCGQEDRENPEVEVHYSFSEEEGKEIRDEKENEMIKDTEEEKEDGSPSKRQRARVKHKKKAKTKPVTKEKAIDLKLTGNIDKEEGMKKTEENRENRNEEKHSKAVSLWKKSTRKALPWTDMCSKLRQRIADENEKQMDLLETIRRLRGISKDEFYKDIASESSDSEPEQAPPQDTRDQETTPEPVNEPEPAIIETEETEEIHEEEAIEEEREEEESPKLPVVIVEKKEEEVRQKPSKKRIISRIDTRWPAGHKFHTKPAEQKYVSFYLKPITHKLSNSNINIHNLPRTAKEITEYLQWREKLLEIAYLNEFSHLRKMSLMTFTMPLPGIEQESYSTTSHSNTNRSSARSTNSTSRNNGQNVTLQQHSYISLSKSNGTRQKSITQTQRQTRPRKKSRNGDSNYVNPYLNSKVVGHWKQNKSKTKTKKIKNEVKSSHGDHYEIPVENELETLMSRIDEDSNQGKYENRNKSQSTDSAINEPSFNSDDEENDVIRSTIRSSSVEKGQVEESEFNRIQDGNMYLPQEGNIARAQQKKGGRKESDFMQTVQHLRTGRYRYLHPLNSKRREQQLDCDVPYQRTQLYRKANVK